MHWPSCCAGVSHRLLGSLSMDATNDHFDFKWRNAEERDVTPQFWNRLLQKNQSRLCLSSKKDGEFFTIITKLVISVAYVKDYHPEYWNHVLPDWSCLHEIKKLEEGFFFPLFPFIEVSKLPSHTVGFSISSEQSKLQNHSSQNAEYNDINNSVKQF